MLELARRRGWALVIVLKQEAPTLRQDAHGLFAAFVDRHSKLCRLRRWTRQEVARQLYSSFFAAAAPAVLDSS